MSDAAGAADATDAIRAVLLEQARVLGADLAGIASIADLCGADAGARIAADGLRAAGRLHTAGRLRAADAVVWPEGARSILVVAVAHPPDKPELDWWFGGSDPPGNKLLARIVQGLCDWIPEESGLSAVHLPYHVERGGAYLKDAAVLAGLGCIGLNNLLVTPQYGPRVRLRALTLDAALSPTGPTGFDPCEGCDARCRAACPQGAFARGAAEPRILSGARWPARTGDFSRPACRVQMELDIATATMEAPAAVAGAATGEGAAKVVRYCRACELACPVGA